MAELDVNRILAWACEVFSPENVYADGERTQSDAIAWACQQYGRRDQLTCWCGHPFMVCGRHTAA